MGARNMDPLIQHFTYPFTFEASRATTVEQDSDEDIMNCIVVALLTPRGSRMFVPGFGIDDPTFTNQKPTLLNQLQESEPRATVNMIEGLVDSDLTQRIKIGVSNLG